MSELANWIEVACMGIVIVSMVLVYVLLYASYRYLTDKRETWWMRLIP